MPKTTMAHPAVETRDLKSGTGSSRRMDGIILAGLFALAVVMAVGVRRNLPDDAFIYLRIAQNVVHHGEWAFNPGVPVNAATSPLYALVVIAITALHLPGLMTPLIVATAFGLFALAAAIYFGVSSEDSCYPAPAGRMQPVVAACFAVAGSTFPVLVLSSGLETPTYLAVIACACLLYQRGRPVLTGFVAGLVALGRPEGCLLFLIFVAMDLLRFRKVSWKAVPGFIVPPILWLLFCLRTFHTIVPHTMAIKSLQSGISIWSESYLANFVENLSAARWLFPLVLLGVWRVAAGLRQRLFLGTVVLFGLLQTAGYVVLHAPAGYFWYDAPGDLAYNLAFMAGLFWLLGWVMAWFARYRTLAVTTSSMGRLYSSCAAVLLVCQVAVALLWLRAHSGPYRYSEDYKTVSNYLRQNSASGDWVAATEIGYIGVYADRPVRDMWGLADPASLPALRQHHWGWWITSDPPPRFILLHKHHWFGEPGNAGSPLPPDLERLFVSRYQLALDAGGVQLFVER